ncbi:MauE/DoxX family redox-associated membrane protein [Microbacterium sp.]|uniref:MauE/DoxX family redox-associated membrane protein n=1 Tax=Microbacterium sp. TaxID=51671 RepID=UPI002811E9DA|nr:MauE/DoxX family redox-associated membrane protein [Microbacterium sp.]
MQSSPVEFIFLFSTGLVAFVLLLSGATKATRTAATLEAMAALRVPDFLQRHWIAAAVPAWEILLGTALLLTADAPLIVAGVLTLGTFAVFTVLLARVLARGEEVDCGCFGALSADTRVTGWTVARNVALIVATVATLSTSPGRPPFVVDIAGAEPATIFAIGLGWALVALAVVLTTLVRLRSRSTGTQTAAGTGPVVAGVGSPIPDAELVTRDGVAVPLHALGAGTPVLLVFLSAECSKCVPVARHLPDWQRLIAPVKLVVATSSRPGVLAERMPDAAPLAYFGALSAKRALGVEGSAAAVLLGGMDHPYVASPIARRDEIDALVQGIVNAREQAS